MKKKVSLQLRIDEDLNKQIFELAQETRESKSEIVRQLISKAITNEFQTFAVREQTSNLVEVAPHVSRPEVQLGALIEKLSCIVTNLQETAGA